MDEHGVIGIFFNTEKNHKYWEKLFNQPGRMVVFFNAVFDMNAIRKLIGHYPKFKSIQDVMVQYRLIYQERESYRLKYIVGKLLNVKTETEEKLVAWKKAYAKQKKIKADFIPYDLIPPRILIPYALDDVIYTAQLYFLTREEIKSNKMEGIYKQECDLIPILADMKWRGIRVDSEGAYRAKITFTRQMQSLQRRIWKEAGKKFNLSSNAETEKTLHDAGYKIKYNEVTGRPILDQFALRRMKGELPKLLADYSQREYDVSHYLKLFSECNNRLHTDLNSVGANTGRFSSWNPNLQNMRRGPSIRRFILPDEGCILGKWDYSQIEMRLFAGMAHIRRMLDHIRLEHDLHEMASVDCINKCDPILRQVFKTINFLIIYGGGPDKLYWELLRKSVIESIPALAQVPYSRAAYFLSRYKETYKEIPQYFNLIKEELERNNCIRNFYGRCYFPTSYFNLNTSYKGVNYVVQGSAADLIKRAMIKIDRDKFPMKLVLQVHDELVYSIPVEEPFDILREEVESGMTDDKINELVPIKVEGSKGENYAELEKLD